MIIISEILNISVRDYAIFLNKFYPWYIEVNKDSLNNSIQRIYEYSTYL